MHVKLRSSIKGWDRKVQLGARCLEEKFVFYGRNGEFSEKETGKEATPGS